MANLKNITELPVAESADALNLIVNDNGAAKQIAASAVGAQADFSVTDENSPAFIKNKPEVVQADWAEIDESSAAFIKNKPADYDLVITINGSLRDSLTADNVTITEGSLDAVLTAFNEGRAPSVKIKAYKIHEEGYCYDGIECLPLVEWYGEYMYFYMLYNDFGIICKCQLCMTHGDSAFSSYKCTEL